MCPDRRMAILFVAFCVTACVRWHSFASWTPPKVARARQLLAEWKRLDDEAFERLLSDNDTLAEHLPGSICSRDFLRHVWSRQCYREHPVEVSRKLWKVVLKARDSRMKKYEGKPTEQARALCSLFFNLGEFAPFLRHLIDREKLGDSVLVGDVLDMVLAVDEGGELSLPISECYEPQTMALIYVLKDGIPRVKRDWFKPVLIDLGRDVKVYNVTAADCKRYLARLEMIKRLGGFDPDRGPDGFGVAGSGYINEGIEKHIQARLAWLEDPKNPSNVLLAKASAVVEREQQWPYENAELAKSVLNELNNPALWRSEGKLASTYARFVASVWDSDSAFVRMKLKDAPAVICDAVCYMANHPPEDYHHDYTWYLRDALIGMGVVSVDPVLKAYEEGRLPLRHACEIIRRILGRQIAKAYLLARMTPENAKTMDLLFESIERH